MRALSLLCSIEDRFHIRADFFARSFFDNNRYEHFNQLFQRKFNNVSGTQTLYDLARRLRRKSRETGSVRDGIRSGRPSLLTSSCLVGTFSTFYKYVTEQKRVVSSSKTILPLGIGFRSIYSGVLYFVCQENPLQT